MLNKSNLNDKVNHENKKLTFQELHGSLEWFLQSAFQPCFFRDLQIWFELEKKKSIQEKSHFALTNYIQTMKKLTTF